MAYHKTPAYRLHKPTGRAVVTLNGKDHYLGQHGTRESRARYDSLISRWLGSGRQADDAPLTVGRLVKLYRSHSGSTYLKMGRPTSTIAAINVVCDDLDKMHGQEQAVGFNSSHFKSVRAAWVARGLAESTIASYSGKTIEVFRWATEERMIPASVWHELKSIRSIRPGTVATMRRDPVVPVPDGDLAACLAVAKPKVAAMIRLQLLTGMRSGELCSMRPMDVATDSTPWIYSPPDHKTSHKGKKRTIALGKEAREILAPLVAGIEAAANVFACPGTNGSGSSPRGDKLAPGSRRHSYASIIARLCIKAGVPHWHPHQLRHNAATRFRKEVGIETTRILLGHSSVRMTEIYAEIDMTKATEAGERLG